MPIHTILIDMIIQDFAGRRFISSSRILIEGILGVSQIIVA